MVAPRCASTLQPGLENRTAPSWLAEPLRHVVKSQQFNQASLEAVLRVAREMEDVRPGTDASRLLQGAIMSTLFYEPSTRTRLSFESAMVRLGGTVLSTESAAEFSSAAKGETLEGGRVRWADGWMGGALGGDAAVAGPAAAVGGGAPTESASPSTHTFLPAPSCCSILLLPAADTIRTVQGYADVVVLRHFQAGSAEKAAAAASIPIINAGDGPGQHPSQVGRSVGLPDGRAARQLPSPLSPPPTYPHTHTLSPAAAPRRHCWMCTQSSARWGASTASRSGWWATWPTGAPCARWPTCSPCTRASRCISWRPTWWVLWGV